VDEDSAAAAIKIDRKAEQLTIGEIKVLSVDLIRCLIAGCGHDGLLLENFGPVSSNDEEERNPDSGDRKRLPLVARHDKEQLLQLVANDITSHDI
jgi:hypothetical protein